MLSLAISAYSLGKSWNANIPERYMTFRGVCIARRVGYKNKSDADFQRIGVAFCGAGEGGRTLTLSELVPKTSASAIPPLPHELSFSLSIFLGIVKAAEMPLFKRNPAGQSAARPPLSNKVRPSQRRSTLRPDKTYSSSLWCILCRTM